MKIDFHSAQSLHSLLERHHQLEYLLNCTGGGGSSRFTITFIEESGIGGDVNFPKGTEAFQEIRDAMIKERTRIRKRIKETFDLDLDE